jgi:hypothetical protein
MPAVFCKLSFLSILELYTFRAFSTQGLAKLHLSLLTPMPARSFACDVTNEEEKDGEGDKFESEAQKEVGTGMLCVCLRSEVNKTYHINKCNDPSLPGNRPPAPSVHLRFEPKILFVFHMKSVAQEKGADCVSACSQ